MKICDMCERGCVEYIKSPYKKFQDREWWSCGAGRCNGRINIIYSDLVKQYFIDNKNLTDNECERLLWDCKTEKLIELIMYLRNNQKPEEVKEEEIQTDPIVINTENDNLIGLLCDNLYHD